MESSAIFHHSDEESALVEQTFTSHSQGSPLSRPPSVLLKSFRCPTTEQGWAEDDQEMAALVVPVVLDASFVKDKNVALSKGIYKYFSGKYVTHTKAKVERRKKSNTDLKTFEEVRKERNKARSDLRRVKRRGGTSASIKALTNHFHQPLHHHKQLSRLQDKRLSKAKAQRKHNDCAKHFSRFAKDALDGGGKSQD